MALSPCGRYKKAKRKNFATILTRAGFLWERTSAGQYGREKPLYLNPIPTPPLFLLGGGIKGWGAIFISLNPL